MSSDQGFPIFTLKQNGKRLAVNPDHVTAVYEDKKNVTDIYTLDCARSADAWDVDGPFDEVVEKLFGTKQREREFE